MELLPAKLRLSMTNRSRWERYSRVVMKRLRPLVPTTVVSLGGLVPPGGSLPPGGIIDTSKLTVGSVREGAKMLLC